jgi:hypothetical protein
MKHKNVDENYISVHAIIIMNVFWKVAISVHFFKENSIYH